LPALRNLTPRRTLGVPRLFSKHPRLQQISFRGACPPHESVQLGRAIRCIPERVMPLLFHGTRRADAVTMAGPPGTIRVDLGSGEFGRGFYTQDSSSNALTWVQHKFPASQLPCLLELDVDDRAYA